jgi:hypothetical protein
MKEQAECTVDEWGTKRWFLNGILHRENGPAIERASGTKEWLLHGKHHREDGPAVEHANGYKEWSLNDKTHREDGPAREWPDGDRLWYLNDREVHPEQIVDLHLSRGTFCYYNEQSNELKFNA